MSTELQFTDDEPQLIDPRDVDETTASKPLARDQAKAPTWITVAEGIWENTRLKRKWKYERPYMGGKRPFLSLETTNLKFAREERARRVSLRSKGIEPMEMRGQPNPEAGKSLEEAPNAGAPLATRISEGPASEQPKVLDQAEPSGKPAITDAKEMEQERTTVDSMGEVIRYYQKCGYPDEYKQQRAPQTHKDEETHCKTLLLFWDKIPINRCGPAACDRYYDWKIARGVRSGKGGRMVNRELNTLNNACKWASRSELITANPIADRPSYQKSTDVKHCREFMPHDVDELHTSAALFFERPETVVMGFQMLTEAYTGLRTCEVFMWGTDHFGTLTPDGGYVNVWRCKGQHAVNPYCSNHKGLKALLKAHAAWKKANHPDSPHFLPSPRGDGPICDTALENALRRLAPRMKRRLRSHGTGRAFYVLMRRSQGVRDEAIAFELGHMSNGACIRST